jgi:hypothetical protein
MSGRSIKMMWCRWARMSHPVARPGVPSAYLEINSQAPRTLAHYGDIHEYRKRVWCIPPGWSHCFSGIAEHLLGGTHWYESRVTRQRTVLWVRGDKPTSQDRSAPNADDC